MGDLNSFGLGVILDSALALLRGSSLPDFSHLLIDLASGRSSTGSIIHPRRKTAAIECASPSSTVDKPKDPLVQLFDLDSWISDDPQPIRF
ncbi:hypothetical protein PGT21_031557 [Puccinia graminis f. sp. tritici]|uniref:Uncharacterized protein n=1 Tax=Puccinia graminis f. sp. tritici TaxID=56615 RepID=A0A5B0R2C4_PUCGR|nr:hypothetical protein PGT21_001157 [Puccinia graminis f. sp. tritici]KAA1119677.1 hypothetical protein PGT21_031557 [Puccinia graminis f. sp. tritici]